MILITFLPMGIVVFLDLKLHDVNTNKKPMVTVMGDMLQQLRQELQKFRSDLKDSETGSLAKQSHKCIASLDVPSREIDRMTLSLHDADEELENSSIEVGWLENELGKCQSNLEESNKERADAIKRNALAIDKVPL